MTAGRKLVDDLQKGSHGDEPADPKRGEVTSDDQLVVVARGDRER